MPIALTDEHRELAEVAAGFLASRDARATSRALLDADSEPLPPFWDELDALGWLARSPDDGLGFSELAIVLEGLGQ